MKRCLIPSVINSKLERYFFIVSSLIVVLHGDGNSTLLSIVLTKLEEESRSFIFLLITTAIILLVFVVLDKSSIARVQVACFHCLAFFTQISFVAILWMIYGWYFMFVQICLTLGLFHLTHTVTMCATFDLFRRKHR